MSNEEIVKVVVELLNDVDGVQAENMFGGTMITCNGTFFGIVYEEALYLRTTQETSQRYISKGMGRFCPSPKVRLSDYYRVPTEVIEDPSEISSWLQDALHAAA